MLLSVGYAGREIGEFVADLAARDVAVLVDVRLTAASRRPGFAKTALREALASAGIDYVHLRALGNPRDNRAAFGGADVAAGRRTYQRAVLDTAAGESALAELRELAAAQIVAVLCVERDEQHCHRAVVLDALRVSGDQERPPRQTHHRPDRSS